MFFSQFRAALWLPFQIKSIWKSEFRWSCCSDFSRRLRPRWSAAAMCRIKRGGTLGRMRRLHFQPETFHMNHLRVRVWCESHHLSPPSASKNFSSQYLLLLRSLVSFSLAFPVDDGRLRDWPICWSRCFQYESDCFNSSQSHSTEVFTADPTHVLSRQICNTMRSVAWIYTLTRTL